MPRSLPPYVYFVRRADGVGPVKIGCSQTPEDRLSALMSWAPYALAIVATIPGDEAVERAFHAKFAASHTHREWFLPSLELDAVIAEVAAGSFDLTSLPAPRLLTNVKRKDRFSENSRRSMSWTHRMRWLRARGVEIPPDVAYAAHRWGAGRYFKDYNPHNPADAAVVEAFLASHPRRSDRKRAE